MGVGQGKLLLFGEHAAVYGHPAIGLQLAETLEVTVEPRPEGEWSLEGIPESARALVRGAVLRAAEIVGREIPAATVSLAGTLPTSVGFGSSAALCIALLRSLDRGQTLSDDRDLWAAAHELEHLFHGTPSGIDTGLAIANGVNIVYPRPPALPEMEPARIPDIRLVVGAIPRTRATAELVAGIRELRDRDPDAVEQRLARLGAFSRSASRATGAAEIGRLADEAQHELAALGLSTDALEHALAAARASGALGAKLSGAGGGGAFFAVFEKDAETRGAEAAIRAAAPNLVYLRTIDCPDTGRD